MTQRRMSLHCLIYTKCLVYIVMLAAVMVIVAFFIMPRVLMLSVVKHNVIILSVMAPFLWYRIQNLKDNLVWIGAEFTNAHFVV
jgi:hypothetical protein